MITVLVVALIANNVAWMVLNEIRGRRHANQVDMLTSKIKAPDLNNYTINRQNEQQLPVVQRRGPQAPGVALAGSREELIPISEANPEEVMQALERQGGYEEE